MPFINGIGAPELIIILVIALIVVGPGRLPDVGSALGKSIREFRKAATDMNEATRLDEKPAQPGPGAVTPANPAPAPVSGAALPPPPPPVANALPVSGESQPNELTQVVTPNTLSSDAAAAPADEPSSVGG